MASIKTAHAMVKALEAEGISHVFGVPGEENLDLLEALGESEQIKFVLTRHEQSAGFMAATVGRLTGKPGVALTTLGPGATNIVTAVAYAQLGAMPLLILTGQKPIHNSKQGAFQIIDVVDMMTPLTKYTKQILTGTKATSMVSEALRVASQERPGAAHLELAEDIAAEQVDYFNLPVAETRRPVAESKAIGSAVELLLAAKRPLLVIGAGANRKRTSNMLTEFVNTFNIVFVETQMGKGVIDEQLAQYGGTAALSSGDYVHDVINASDLIINIGHDVVEKPPFIMDPTQKVIHLNFEPASVNEVYFPQVEVVGDIANAIWQIKEAITEAETKPDWDTNYHEISIKKLEQSFQDSLIAAGDIITPQVLVNEVRTHLDSEDIVTLDNGMYKIWFARHYKTRAENTLLLDNALATMGAGVPSALASKLIHPDRRVVAVVGDGGFMMNSQELETAVRLDLKVTILVLNDKCLQMINWKQQKMGLKSFGLEFGNPDFVAYAKSYGANGLVAKSNDELAKVLKQADKLDGPTVVDVRIDYSHNKEDLNMSH